METFATLLAVFLYLAMASGMSNILHDCTKLNRQSIILASLLWLPIFAAAIIIGPILLLVCGGSFDRVAGIFSAIFTGDDKQKGPVD